MAKSKRKQQTGFFWHVHHDIVVEYCWDYDERVVAIQNTKPENEVNTRLHLFRPVKGHLPAAVRAAGLVWKEAMEARRRAWGAYRDGSCAPGPAARAYDRARQAHDEARTTWHKAIADNKEELEALHKQECGCKEWNGTEIVFPKVKK